MSKKKGITKPFYRDPKWLIPIIITIMTAVIGGPWIITQTDVDTSNSSQSPICIGENCAQNITYQQITYNYYRNQSTFNESCSDNLNIDCYTPQNINKNDCINDITVAEGIIDGGILIDDCDVLVTKLEDDETPVKSGTVSLWIKFSNIKSNKNRYLFDAFDEYKKNRISLYLEPDGFLTFSLFDGDYTTIQIRDKLNSEELSDWTQMTVTWEEHGGILKLFVNEDLKRTRDISNINFDAGFKAFFIGSNIYGEGQAYGIIDEVRFSSVARSEDWINQSYQMVANQDKLVSWGPIETLN